MDYDELTDSTKLTDSSGDFVFPQFHAKWCIGGTLQKQASGYVPTTDGYVKLATIRIVSGKLRVRQHHMGAVTAQCHFISP